MGQTMQHAETIVVGGGPAGSTAAWELCKHGHDVLIVDKASFPRHKLCAGWITSSVLQDLQFTPEDYPHPMLKMQIRSHVKGLPFVLTMVPTNGDNYSIRRSEFDAWLLERCGAPVATHTVKNIRRHGDVFILDETFSCRNLIGAGGTSCPVRRILFPKNRRKFRQVVTLEREFQYPSRSDLCHLYFIHHGTKGYAWYVPKGNGGVNIGLGAKANYYKANGINIHQQFRSFLERLVREKLLDQATAGKIECSGHPYYLYSDHGEVKQDRCYLIGDSAGLASVDFGEGIGPAIESGIMAAQEILGTGSYKKEAVTQFTSTGLFQKIAKRILMPKRS